MIIAVEGTGYVRKSIDVFLVQKNTGRAVDNCI